MSRSAWLFVLGVLFPTSSFSAWCAPPGDPGQAPAKPARVDAAGDPLPDGALARLGTTRFRHGGRISALSLSPDGKCLVTTGFDDVRVWDASDGRLVRRIEFDNHNSQLRSVAAVFTSDSKHVVVAQGILFSLVEVATGKALWKAAATGPGQGGSIQSMAYAPDGKTFAVLKTGLELWDVGTRKSQMVRPAGRAFRMFESFSALAYAPDSRLLAAANDHDVELWDVGTRQRVRVLPGHTGPVYAVAFAHGGKLLASAGDDKTIRLWDVSSGALVRELKGHRDKISGLAFAPDDKTLVSSSGIFGLEVDAPDARLRHWDVTTGKELGQFPVEGGEVAALALAPDGKRLFAVTQPAVRVWDVPARKPLGFAGHYDGVSDLAFGPDGRTIVSGSADESVRRWDAATGRARWTRLHHNGRTPFLAFSRQGDTVVAIHVDGTLSLVDAADGTERRHLGLGGPLLSAASSSDGKLLITGDRKRNFASWNAATGEKQGEWNDPEVIAWHAALSADGSLLATGGSSTSRSSMSSPVQLWDVKKGALLRVLGTHPDYTITGLAFTHDGERVVSLSPTGVRLWTVAGGDPSSIDGWNVPARAHGLTVSPNGRMLATGDLQGVIRLWEVSTRRERRVLTGHFSQVTSLAFAPDGRTLASGAWDTTILVWPVPGVPDKPVTPADLAAAWDELASDDAAKAYRALGVFVAASESAVAFLNKRMHPAFFQGSKPPSDRIAELESTDLAVRTQAQQELLKLGSSVEPVLRRALAGKPTLELRQRLTRILEQVDSLTADLRQAVRAVEALEYIATPAARELLAKLAGGADGARLTVEAKASLERLGGATRSAADGDTIGVGRLTRSTPEPQTRCSRKAQCRSTNPRS